MMYAPANLQQHPLSAAFPRLKSEEVASLLACEGLVHLTEDEAKAATSLKWFKTLTASKRALFVVSLFDWLAKGSNQYVKKVHATSHRHLAQVAQQVNARAAV